MIAESPEDLLAEIIGVGKQEIEAASALTDYREVRAPKKRGGYRTIHIPPDPLKRIQRLILKRLLCWLWWQKPDEVYGLRKGSSFVTHARHHKQAKWIFQFDLKDAFPSVDVSLLEKVIFSRLLEELMFFVDRICDGLGRQGRFKKSVFFATSWGKGFAEEVTPFPSYGCPSDRERLERIEGEIRALTKLVIKLTTFKGIVPQGTPTAPFLFYIALLKSGLLGKLRAICPEFLEDQEKYWFKISVYVDGFVVSAQIPIPQENQERMLEAVAKAGFKVNPRKVRHDRTKQGNCLITGLRVAPSCRYLFLNDIVLPKRRIRRWRGLIHRAIYEPELRPRVRGFIASLKPIYEGRIPPQIRKPYEKLLQTVEEE